MSENQLEELIFRLAEADVAELGHSPACVDWSGHQNAPDGKIDIHVKVAAPKLKKGFLDKPNTILQSKKSKMRRSEILSEMQTKDRKLHPTLSQQAKIGGSYIIVSLEDDCSPPMKEGRLAAMREAVSGDPNKDKINLNFFDRSKLVQWLRQHPAVLLWVKGKLGQGYSGWQPYGSWSNPPKGAKDTLILAPGVSVHLPTERGQNVPIEDAIEPMRDLIGFSSKAIRITGLSGVGKTRIVQALFDETVDINALDRTIAMYVDTVAEPDPSASEMLDELIAENRRSIMIVDNCPSNLHSSLASKVSAAGGDVRLITVEYDIKDDKPYMTEVIHIETNGPGVSEELLLRRFPSIGKGNARRIAKFADGNAKVSLAIAERVHQGESLAKLSDCELFRRLFEQRKVQDGDLYKQAEVLSLVYSFSIDPDVAPNELEVLGSISGHSYSQLFRSVNTMTDRHIIQKRSDMRAIMPHAIANRLAASGLNNITVATLRATFEASGHHRLLMSFAHRLGLMHDHAIAKEIVEAWLQPDGLLGQISNLDETESMILNCIGPVAPEALLNRIEAELTLPDFQGLQPLHNPPRTTILNLLRSLAYESQAFDRCIKLLIDLADNEDEDNIHDAVRDKISRFFQPYLSGTHASLVQRLAILDECLGSEKAGRRSLGITLLSTALDGPRWPSSGLYEFGARPRDYGYQPNHGQLVEWRSAFVDVVVRLTTSDDPDLRNRLSQVLADKFRGLWRQEAMREKLITAAKQINNHQPWTEGWKAIRSMIYDHTERNDKQDPEMSLQSLIELDKEFEPSDLVSIIQTYIFGKEYGNISDYYDKTIQLSEKIPELGKQFAVEGHHLDELGPDLFENNFMPYRSLFGKGLAIGAHDLRIVWTDIVRYLEQSSGSCDGLGIIREFFKKVASIDFGLSREFLDECATHSKLRRSLVELYPYSNFSESDLDRCMTILDDDETPPCMFGHFFWRDHYAHLPSDSRCI